jgi:hypothetical protein
MGQCIAMSLRGAQFATKQSRANQAKDCFAPLAMTFCELKALALWSFSQ